MQAVVRPEERLKRIMSAVGGMWAPFQGPAAQAFGVELARQAAVTVRRTRRAKHDWTLPARA